MEMRPPRDVTARIQYPRNLLSLSKVVVEFSSLQRSLSIPTLNYSSLAVVGVASYHIMTSKKNSPGDRIAQMIALKTTCHIIRNIHRFNGAGPTRVKSICSDMGGCKETRTI